MVGMSGRREITFTKGLLVMSNVFSCVGNLSKDAELRDVGGHSVLNFNVANNLGYGDKKSVLWLRCALWGKRGESIAQYLTKGTKVFVTGELTTSEYEGKTNLELRVNAVDFAGGKNDQQAAPATAPQQQQQQAAPAQQQPDSESLPF